MDNEAFIKCYVVVFLVCDPSVSILNTLGCSTDDSLFVKYSHEINNTNPGIFNQQIHNESEEKCFSRCHLIEDCLSAQFSYPDNVCKLSDFTSTSVNTIIKHSSATKTFHKKKCGSLHKLISYVDDVVDCKDIYNKGWDKNGIYGIQSSSSADEYEPILCEMSLSGGGWTVIQQRVDGAVDFFRIWADYKNGFGRMDGNFWFGNDRIHKLTWSTSNEIIIPTTHINGNYYLPRYNEFKVNSEENKYQLTVGSYMSGFESVGYSPGSGLEYHNQRYFTTKDVDNDIENSENCAVGTRGGGGWWYGACHKVNLNGIYGVNGSGTGVIWTYALDWYSLRKVQMMVRRK